MIRKSSSSFVVILVLLLAAGAVLGAADDPFRAAREEMVREIEGDVRGTSERIGKTALDSRVMEIMARVPRHEFVPRAEIDHAYENRPLPIGYGQTISQPYIVAIMTDLLKVGSGSVVLEVGTGSGYQAAILAEYVRSVYSIEIIEELAETAAERLRRRGYDNVQVRAGDGYYGWKEHAPFDGIVVTAAASHIPPPLLDQLKPGGRMIIPVGGPFFVQQLMLVEKGQQGEIQTRQVLPVAFVPLTGGH
jgi:protein-L-isoaspartate(D-aspartate) O-methyltransferase